MPAQVKISRMFILKRENGSRTRAFADVVVGGIKIRGMRVVKGSRGLFVGMPQEVDSSGKYRNVVYFVDKDLRKEVEKAVLSEYESRTKKRGGRGRRAGGEKRTEKTEKTEERVDEEVVGESELTELSGALKEVYDAVKKADSGDGALFTAVVESTGLSDDAVADYLEILVKNGWVERIGAMRFKAAEEKSLREVVLNVIAELDDGGGARYIDIARETGLGYEKTEKVLKELMQDGEIYEPRIGRFKRV